MTHAVTSEAEAVYRAYIDAENSRDRPAMEACLSPALAVAINGVTQLADRDADAAATDRLLESYADYRRDILSLGSYTGPRGITVVAEWSMNGTSDSAAMPRLSVFGCTLALVEWQDGRAVITGARLYVDPTALAHVL